MSSHYIIRDDQEPALLLYDIAAIKEEAVFSLLEWNPLVIAYESAIGFILHNRIKIDAVIINNLNEEDIYTLLEAQRPFDILQIKNLGDNLKEYLSFRGMHALDIIGEFGTHTLRLANKIQKLFPVNIFSGNVKYIHAQNSYRKWSSPGRGFKINSVDNKNLETSNLNMIESGIYVVDHEGAIEVKSSHPIWIGEVIF